MRKTLLFCFLFVSALSASAQWKTIYEGGFGTSVSLRYDCGSRFEFNAGGSNSESVVSFNVTDNQNRIGMYASLSPFNSQTELTAGIYKFIPEMEQYASLRVYLDLDLPDSVGTVHYAKLMDTTFNDPLTGASTWTDFATDLSSSLVYFSNPEGDNTIYLYTVFDVSPGFVRYNYLRVEADTTKILSVPAIQPDFKVFTSGKELHIQPSQPEAEYEVQVFDLSGKCIFREQKTGQQHIPVDYSKGIYLVKVGQNETQYQTKVYIE